MNFGDLVLVKAQVVRLVRYGGSQVTTTRDALRYGPVHTSADAGEALEGSTDPLDLDARVRRFPYPEPKRGAVVGFTVRVEGKRSASVNTYGYEREVHLAPSRRVNVVEVALESEGKARLILALADDLALLRVYPFEGGTE